jgi:dolichyl-phosphate beta-glucosyltransferase
MHLSVVIPAYNEAERLPRTLLRVKEYYDSQGFDYEIIVVDDGSADTTATIAAETADGVISVSPNRGKGFAVRAGVLAATGDYVLFCDADLATPPEEDQKLFARIKAGADVAIGSRPLRESDLEIRQPWYREMLGRGFNLAVQTIGVSGIQDTQCGFKLFTRAAGQDVFSRAKVNRFGFDFEALMIARDLGYRIDEVGVRWRHQEGSKVNPVKDGIQMLGDLVRLRLKGKRNRIAPNPISEAS